MEHAIFQPLGLRLANLCWLFKSTAVKQILIVGDGVVVEWSRGHLFLARDNGLSVLPEASGRDSLMQDMVMTLARDAGYPVVDAAFTREALLAADELFVCGPAADVVAVRKVDDHLVGQGQVGRITQKIREMVTETVRGRSRRSLHWLEYVVSQPLF